MIHETIEAKNYVATEHEVEQLAAAHVASDASSRRGDGQYLRILIAALRAQFDGNKRRKPLTTADTLHHSDYLAATHTRLYAYVLKGVTTPETIDDPALAPDERRARGGIRNARAGFARSAASTLQGFIRAGGDVRTLEVATVTKGQLRNWVAEHTPGADNPHQTSAAAALKRLLRDAQALAAEDPDAGREAIQGALDALQAALVLLEDTAHRALTESGVFQTTRGPAHRPALAAAPA